MGYSNSKQPVNQQVQDQRNDQSPAIAQFVDNRASSITQLQMQRMMSVSPQAVAQHQSQTSIHISPVTQRQVIQNHVDEESVQGKFSAEPAAQFAEKPNNTGLPNQLKAGIESLSGMSMDHVKVHFNSDKPAQLNAHAYAQGSDIHVAPGQEKHLPHEAWHVVQQAQGRVKPTVQMKAGVAVNDDAGLEVEADIMGARALHGGFAQHTNATSNPVQRVVSAIIQRVFSPDAAKAFVLPKLNGIVWPDKKPDDLFAWFRTLRGVAAALRDAPRWEEDVEGQEESKNVMVEILEGQWAIVAAEKERVKTETELRLAKEDAATRVTPALQKHVFKGDFKAGSTTPTGYHSTADGSPTHLAYGGRTTIGGLGVYQQSVKGKLAPKTKKPIQSTFFPESIDGRSTTKDDVILALGTAMNSESKTVKFPLAWRGMVITKVGDTWFPSGGSDDLLAE